MDKFVTSFRSLKRQYEDNEFETDNPGPSEHEREREPDIQEYNISSKINATIDEKENYLLDEEMKPISTCEKPSFRALIIGLTSDNFVPDRRAISNQLLNKYKTYVTDLTNVISEKMYKCITTDIWSSLNKSYLGMTLHYIEEKSHNQFSYVLACQRIEGSHNYSNIAKCISKVMNSYKINVTKITHTVTDNASKFGKAFRVYVQQFAAPKTVSTNNVTLDAQNINILMDVLDQNIKHNFELEFNFLQNDIENEPEDIIDIVNVSDILTIASNNYNEYSEDNNDLDMILSNHITCSAHTLNLVATIDTSKITNNQYKMLSRSAFEWNFLEEYIKVMHPLTTALDELQGEKSCYLDNDSGDEFYTPISNSQLSTSPSESSNQYRCGNLASVQGLSYMNSKKKDGKHLTTLDYYPIVKHIYLKYNTTLPSSAPVERLFSNGTQILTPRRNRLSDKTFEMLMCLKSNKFNV
ncbi:hypothetical protein QTP88_001574 [Uroleucon formosanum]